VWVRETNDGGCVDRWLGPDDHVEVALHTRIDGPHAWPRGQTFDAADVLWDFFASHPRVAR